MSPAIKPSDEALSVRELGEGEESQAVALLLRVFGEWPKGVGGVSPAEFFDWKHRAGAFGPSRVLIAELDGAIAGMAAYIPWRFRVGTQTVIGARAVDLAVDPAHRRLGISSAVRTAANRLLAGEAAFLWGNPNAQSHAGGYRTGASDAATIEHFVQPGQGWRGTLRRVRGKGARTPEQLPVEAQRASEALRDDSYLAGLLEARGQPQQRLTTDIDPSYLRWRYGQLGDYRAVSRETTAGACGIAIFRARRSGSLWGADICELLVEGGDARAARDLLRRVRRAAPTDFLICACTSSASAARWGLAPSGRGTVLTTVTLETGLVPDPAGRRSWALSRGDLELI